MTNVTFLGVLRTLAQKEYGKVWEMKSIFSTFIFKTSNAFTQSLV